MAHFSDDHRPAKFGFNSGYGYEYQEETSEIWVADFGSHEDIEQTLRTEVVKLRPRLPKYISWILGSLFLLIILVLAEWLIRILGQSAYWPERAIMMIVWLWRLSALALWFYVARVRWLIDWRKLFIMTALAFVLATIISGILRVYYVQAAWAWLNLLVDPIWMVLLIAGWGAGFYRWNNKKSKKIL